MHKQSSRPRNSETPRHAFYISNAEGKNMNLHLFLTKWLKCTGVMLLKNWREFYTTRWSLYSLSVFYFLIPLTKARWPSEGSLLWHPTHSPSATSAMVAQIFHLPTCFIHNQPVNFHMILFYFMCKGVLSMCMCILLMCISVLSLYHSYS